MAEQTRSADQMVSILLRDPARLKFIAQQKNPAEALQKLANKAKEEAKIPPKAYMVVVYALSVVAVVAVSGVILLVAIGGTPPEMLLALGSASIGAMAGLLVKPPASE